MLTCLFQLQKTFPLLLFLVCPSMAGWLAISGATWWSSIPVSGASAGLRCPPLGALGRCGEWLDTGRDPAALVCA